jgi:hypothetical protein
MAGIRRVLTAGFVQEGDIGPFPVAPGRRPTRLGYRPFPLQVPRERALARR